MTIMARVGALFLSCALMLIAAAAELAWQQVGRTLYGGVANDLFGSRPALSRSGNVLVASAEYRSTEGFIMNGKVSAWALDERALTQFGPELRGQTDSERLGSDVAVSDSGMVMALGALGAYEYEGEVNVFEWSATVSAWQRRGSVIRSPMSGSWWFGISVAISADGSIVAASDIIGRVAVFRYDLERWYQLGNLIETLPETGSGGSAISLSSDGLTVVVGAFAVANHRGSVRVFRFGPQTGWKQVGQTIVGSNDFDYVGSHSLSADATTLAVGFPGSDVGGPGSGLVRIYQIDSTTKQWNHVKDIVGPSKMLGFGLTVSLADNGATLAIGAAYNETVWAAWSASSGSVFVYRLNNGTAEWEILPRESLPNHYHVYLSGDGRTLVTGLPGNNAGKAIGEVNVFKLVEKTTTPAPTPLFCPAGSEAVDGKEVCNKCPTGMFRNEAMPKCAPCADGNEPNDTQSDCIDAGVSKDTVYSVVVPAVLSVVAAAGGYLFKKRRQQQSTEVLQSSAGAEKA